MQAPLVTVAVAGLTVCLSGPAGLSSADRWPPGFRTTEEKELGQMQETVPLHGEPHCTLHLTAQARQLDLATLHPLPTAPPPPRSQT
jgi:hypothetical protein